ncbi:hypothetical protein BCL90_0960 [Pedobacter alluvionis]|uniref:Uncharacterized protein n=1 Tax=Pedobacter alluvionis TaxID=475253 RepID=A0A497YBF4_9SPHI|nr:hypothetical protein BCL90_0960 [Pedobacter alluvionis]
MFKIFFLRAVAIKGGLADCLNAFDQKIYCGDYSISLDID